MTADQLKEVMKFQLKNFNDEGVAIEDGTVHNTVLAEDDGFSPTTSSKAVYRAFIRNTLSRNGGGDPRWPAGWMDLDVKTLADSLMNGDA